jgi:pimeloyl-ACP methyl ester carboxylesterase
MSTVFRNGITMGYDDRGAGPALVLVHGHPFDRSMWRPQLERFSRLGWRVIAPELRGYGESPRLPLLVQRRSASGACRDAPLAYARGRGGRHEPDHP